MNANVVWTPERGWHDGPRATVALVPGRGLTTVSIEAECRVCGEWSNVPGHENPEDTLCVGCAEEEQEG